jgi:hypothetical protein
MVEQAPTLPPEVADQSQAENKNERQFPLEKSDCIAIAGSLCTKEGMSAAITPELKTVFKNVDMYSASFSSDPMSRRNPVIAQDIRERISGERNVNVLFYSIGADEMEQIVEHIEAQDPTFFDNPDNLKRLKITLMSPAGMVPDMKGMPKFIKKTMDLLASQANPNSLTQEQLSESLARSMAIESFITYPPKEIDPSAVTDMFRSPLSQPDEENLHHTKIAFDPERKYSPLEVNEETARKIDSIDYVLGLLTERLNNPQPDDNREELQQQLKEFILRRGQILIPQTFAEYNKKPELDDETKELVDLLTNRIEKIQERIDTSQPEDNIQPFLELKNQLIHTRVKRSTSKFL